MFWTRRRAVALAVALAGVATISVLLIRPRGECVDQVKVTRAATDDVLISWRARCLVTRLVVYRGGAALWGLDGRITSPVRYGQVPPTVRGLAVPREPLRSGVTYHLELEFDDPSALTGLALFEEFQLAP
jgi:hypothetical protein